MTQEPLKSNSTGIIIAIIGVIGTVIAAVITVAGITNVEKMRQEAELTRIALASNTTQVSFTEISETPTLISSAILISKHFNNFGYECTWTNYDFTIWTCKITQVDIDGNNVTMKYDFENGILKGILKGNTLSGTWQQDTRGGSFELVFVSDFSSATGWWDDITHGDPKPKYEFGLK